MKKSVEVYLIRSYSPYIFIYLIGFLWLEKENISPSNKYPMEKYKLQLRDIFNKIIS